MINLNNTEMKTLATQNLEKAQVKRYLVSKGLIQLGFNGEIQESEIEKCISSLDVYFKEAQVQGIEVSVFGLYSKEGDFLYGFMKNHTGEREINSSVIFDNVKQQIESI